MGRWDEETQHRCEIQLSITSGRIWSTDPYRLPDDLSIAAMYGKTTVDAMPSVAKHGPRDSLKLTKFTLSFSSNCEP